MIDADVTEQLLQAVRSCQPCTTLWAELCFELARDLFGEYQPAWQQITVGSCEFETGVRPRGTPRIQVEQTSTRGRRLNWIWCWCEFDVSERERTLFRSVSLLLINWVAYNDKQFGSILSDSNEARFDHLLFDNHPIPIWIYDRETLKFLAVNDAAIVKYGYSRHEFLSMTIADIRPAEDVPALHLNLATGPKGFNLAGSWRHRTRDGRLLKVDIAAHTLDFEGRPAEIVMATDLTTLINTEEQLLSIEAKLNLVFESETHCLKIVSPEGYLIRMNPAGLRLLDVEDLSQIAGCKIVDHVVEGDRIAFESLHRRALLGMTVTGSFRIRSLRGTIRRVESTCTPIVGDDRHVTSILSVTIDQTESDHAKRLIEEKDERLRLLSSLTSDVFWEWCPDGFTWRSDLEQESMELGVTQVVLTTLDWADRIYPKDREKVLKSLLALLENQDCSWSVEYRLSSETRPRLIIQDRGFVVRNQTGQFVRMIGTSTDVTNRRRLEGTLLRRKKLEAVGILAGGVAHDFNNLLLVILGSVDIIRREADCPLPLVEMLNGIRDAAVKAKGLTSQLLAFGRRQHLKPERLDLQQVVPDIMKTVSRLVSPSISLLVNVEPDINPILFDQSQFMQVVINLVKNAGDAMPGGGCLRIRVRNRYVSLAECDTLPIDAGQYVLLEFSDSGTGMCQEIREHIFEPFFTTKDIGQGTGLGLSTVYGIVQQSEGLIMVESEPGRGTTFQIFLKAISPGN